MTFKGIRYTGNTESERDAHKLGAWKKPEFDEERIAKAHADYLRERAEIAKKAKGQGYFRVEKES